MNYFENGRDKDKRELQLTKDTIERVSIIFPKVVLENRWPYEISDNKKIEIPTVKVCDEDKKCIEEKLSYSHSTNAMILFSLIAASGKIKKDSPLLPDVNLIEPFDFQKDKKIYESVWNELINQIESELIDKKQITYSSTFGKNDILTLSWLIEIIRSETFKKNVESSVEKALNDAIWKKASNLNPKSKKIGGNWLEWKDEKQRRSIDHAFLALRYVQLKLSHNKFQETSLKSKDANNLDPFVEYFDNRIHEQLSKFEIRDGDFDAAELVFALEGLLLVKPLSISRAKLDRVFHVITVSQDRNPYWRPVKPISATPQGRVLFPLSVETASSLIRCCNLIEKKFDESDYFSKNLDLFRRYAEWLRSRATTGIAKIGTAKIEFHGWYSEHVHTHPGIHIWETANVFLFLHYYSFMLEKHIARRSLEASGLSVQGHSKSKNNDAEMVEPLNSESYDEKLRPYSYAKKHLIDPRIGEQTNEEKAYSILLYGPPGTGKTNFAEYICGKLEWPLITVTPSDIVQGGESEVEARAKIIFEVLEDQFDVVILLDEIDRMILDRSSVGYNKQGDFFQFMTPGMLTKLRNLRKKKRCIFIIATNYKERIDSAAIRKGRIDEHLLMSVPDKKARIKNLNKLIFEKTGIDKKKQKPDDMLENIAEKTGLYSYSELEGLVKDATAKLSSGGKIQYEKIIESINNALQDRATSDNIDLTSYKNRFKGDDEYPQKPFVEFFILLHTKLETDRLDQIEKELVKIAFQKLMGSEDKVEPDKEDVADKIQKKFSELVPFSAKIIEGYYNKQD